MTALEELDHHHAGVGPQGFEGGAQGEGEAEASDEDAGARRLAQRLADELGEALLGVVSAGGHELHAGGADVVVAVVAVEGEHGAVGRRGLVEPLELLHRARSMVSPSRPARWRWR
jgi:hypothetical protein